MEGGGTDGGWTLGNIGDYKEANDIWPIGSASIFTINLAVLLTKLGGLGGVTLNSYFDTFGLEGLMANTAWVVILFQIARWAYTTFYTSGGRPWSPIVFVTILLVVQVLHDLLFYYGLLNQLPTTNNEMLESLKRYAQANGTRAVGSHATFFIVIAVIAMFLKESSFIWNLIVINVGLYLLPFVLNMRQTKTAQPPPSAEKKAPKEGYQGGASTPGFGSSLLTGASGRGAMGDRRIQSWNSLRD